MQAMLSAEKHRRPSLALLPRQRRRALRARMAWVAAAVGGELLVILFGVRAGLLRARMEASKQDRRESPGEPTGGQIHTKWFALYFPDNKKHPLFLSWEVAQSIVF